MNDLTGFFLSLHDCRYAQFHNTGSAAGIQFFYDPCSGLMSGHRSGIKMAGPSVAPLSTGKDQNLSADIRAEFAVGFFYDDTRFFV